MRHRLFVGWLVLPCVLLAVPLCAQVVNNPSTIEFNASADHAATTGNTLTSYVLTVKGPGTKTTDIGKPTPVKNVITYTGFAAAYAGLPACPVVAGALSACYTVTVAAKGPGGTSASTVASDPFSSGTAPPVPVPPAVPLGKPVIR